MKLFGRVYDVSIPLFEKLELSCHVVSHFKLKLCRTFLDESLYVDSSGTRTSTVSNQVSYRCVRA
jgi:hypothetical protein